MTRRKTKPASDTRIVVGYCRVSTGEQAEEGVSLDAQRNAIEGYCQMRGLRLAEMVTDPGISGGKPLACREGGRRVLELLRSGKVGGVVSMKLDRLFRNAVDCLTTVERWDRVGTALHLLDLGGQSIDTSTAMGKMFLTMAAGFAELERNITAERTVTALDRKREKGERLGRVPFGYRVAADGVHLEESPDEQYVLRRLARLRAEGLTYQQVVDCLNHEGVAPPRAAKGGKQGTRWHLATVHRVLNRQDAKAA